MDTIITTLSYVIPCWLINMGLNGIYAAKLIYPGLAEKDVPLDLKALWPWDARRLLGSSTTLLGVPVAIGCGILVESFYTDPLQGLVKGLAVYAGHALGSFIKRRAGLGDGQFLPVVDHGDYVILAGIIFGLLGWQSWPVVSLSIILTFLVHPLATYFSYRLGLRKYPW